jgi:hypothetical protein
MPSMRSFRGLVARLKSPATKHQQHSTEAACDDTLVSKVSACHASDSAQHVLLYVIAVTPWQGLVLWGYGMPMQAASTTKTCPGD